jgi:arylformamidase
VELLDLTQPLGPGLPVQPGDPPFSLVRACTHDQEGYEVTQVCLGSHTGTHVDAPRHLFPGGRTLDQFPLERLVGPGVLLDCRQGANAQAERIAQGLSRYSLPPRGPVLLWTEGASLTLEAAEVLLCAGAGLVGIDSPSVDEPPYAVHRLLLACDVLIVENLWGLERLGPGPVNCAFLPLALVGTDGAPVRAMAWRTTGSQSPW